MEQEDSGSGPGSGGRFRRKPRPYVSDEAAALRVPPNSLEAEQAVLGGLLLDNSTWDSIADRLRAEDFYRRDHQLIFEAILDLSQKGEPSDAVTLAERLASKGLADETGGLRTSRAWRATRPPPKTSAPMPTSSASARCCGS
jgi:hypothetical protein